MYKGIEERKCRWKVFILSSYPWWFSLPGHAGIGWDKTITVIRIPLTHLGFSSPPSTSVHTSSNIDIPLWDPLSTSSSLPLHWPHLSLFTFLFCSVSIPLLISPLSSSTSISLPASLVTTLSPPPFVPSFLLSPCWAPCQPKRNCKKHLGTS